MISGQQPQPPALTETISGVSKDPSRNGGKIDFFDFLSIRPVLSIIVKKCHLSIKNQFCS